VRVVRLGHISPDPLVSPHRSQLHRRLVAEDDIFPVLQRPVQDRQAEAIPRIPVLMVQARLLRRFHLFEAMGGEVSTDSRGRNTYTLLPELVGDSLGRIVPGSRALADQLQKYTTSSFI